MESTPRPVGRPPEIPFTDELGQEICDRLADGETLTEICKSPGMPNRSQVWRWLQRNAEFAANHARARTIQGHRLADEHKAVITETRAGVLPPDIARVVLGGLQWQARVLSPKDYGDKLDTTLSGPNGGPIPFQQVERRLVDPNGDA